jgi:hypothetical protein
MGIAGTGTVRQNRLFKVPIPTKKELEHKKIEKGFCTAVYNSDQVLCVWKDSKPVFVASNKYHPDLNSTCERYNRTEKKNMQVPIPDLIKQYNTGMGGVDLLDSQVAVYRVPFRIKKWYFPFWTWSIVVMAVNAWRLRQNVRGRKEPYLDFLRELVVEMFARHGRPPVYRIQAPVTNTRYDGMNHWIEAAKHPYTGKAWRRNCKRCYEVLTEERKSSFACEKCKIPLHIECFKAYHKAF